MLRRWAVICARHRCCMVVVVMGACCCLCMVVVVIVNCCRLCGSGCRCHHLLSSPVANLGLGGCCCLVMGGSRCLCMMVGSHPIVARQSWAQRKSRTETATGNKRKQTARRNRTERGRSSCRRFCVVATLIVGGRKESARYT